MIPKIHGVHDLLRQFSPLGTNNRLLVKKSLGQGNHLLPIVRGSEFDEDIRRSKT
jgi:hypothetical protein